MGKYHGQSGDRAREKYGKVFIVVSMREARQGKVSRLRSG